ncbi:simple sugar transport system permease protein [Arcanobacterium wilhelmae]|uniref:Simple sugar transport system permease protein n=1 Tax=Arcanobacterium wilhelmae TaxID=1803177 RepID=A0ABT9ND72_9ACTO|nr:ABC transporter permease [Arcanobacterium wilhelmae]MDP9801468.1 simple sugar transport system permease protein [Arcanobacterium wilhelmae]WFN90799.1 ABC transporter permease [Arcanobacterium wilhelmae]
MARKEIQPAKPGLGVWFKAFVHAVPRSGLLVGLLAVVIAFVIGALLILISGESPLAAYDAMFRGAIFNYNAANIERALFRPIGDTLMYATPLILAGLGLGVGFRAGLFNIGGTGQLVFGSLAAIWVAFNYPLPPVLHTVVALLAAAIAGGIYAGIAGVLKAKTGANEVIVTIMLNSISGLALSYILLQKAWQRPGTGEPRTPVAMDSASFDTFIPGSKLHTGIIVALLAVLFYWWLLNRSKVGFEIRAVGANPNAARTAGMSTGRTIIITMVVSGMFVGLAGANEALGTLGYVDQNIAGTVGFDAITVALLGQSSPIGILLSGILFGAFKAGGYTMQSSAHVPIDMILILQSTIVLLIAAPALVRFLFRLPKPDKMSMREYVRIATSGGSVAHVDETGKVEVVANAEEPGEVADAVGGSTEIDEATNDSKEDAR